MKSQRLCFGNPLTILTKWTHALPYHSKCELANNVISPHNKRLNSSVIVCDLSEDEFPYEIRMQPKEKHQVCDEKDKRLICTIINAVYEEVGIANSSSVKIKWQKWNWKLTISYLIFSRTEFWKKKAIEELMYTTPESGSFFPKTKELVAAILSSRKWGIKENELKELVLNYEHEPPFENFPVLSDLQKQVVQGFIRTIFDADDGFDIVCRLKSPMLSFQSPFLRKCMYCDQKLAIGSSLSELFQAECKMKISSLENDVKGMPPVVPNRNSLPDRWRNVVICLVVFLRNQAYFS